MRYVSTPLSWKATRNAGRACKYESSNSWNLPFQTLSLTAYMGGISSSALLPLHGGFRPCNLQKAAGTAHSRWGTGRNYSFLLSVVVPYCSENVPLWWQK